MATEKLAEKNLSKQKHIDIVSLLCKAGARINCKDSKNLTPLHYACRSNSEVRTNSLTLFVDSIYIVYTRQQWQCTSLLTIELN